MNQQIFGKKSEKKSGSLYCIKWFTLPPEGSKVTLPPSNKGEQEIFRDVKVCNWIKNGKKINIYVYFNTP